MLRIPNPRLTTLTTTLKSHLVRQPFKYPLPQRLINPDAYMQYVKQHTRIAEVVGEQKLRRLYTELRVGALRWRSVERTVRGPDGGFLGLYVYGSLVLGEYRVWLRVNQFPDEPLYTVIYEDIDIVHINDFPTNWDRSKPNQQ